MQKQYEGDIEEEQPLIKTQDNHSTIPIPIPSYQLNDLSVVNEVISQVSIISYHLQVDAFEVQKNDGFASLSNSSNFNQFSTPSNINKRSSTSTPLNKADPPKFRLVPVSPDTPAEAQRVLIEGREFVKMYYACVMKSPCTSSTPVNTSTIVQEEQHMADDNVKPFDTGTVAIVDQSKLCKREIDFDISMKAIQKFKMLEEENHELRMTLDKVIMGYSSIKEFEVDKSFKQHSIARKLDR